MGTFEQDYPDIPMTARDVLTDEELEAYVRQGGKPWNRASGTAPEDEPPPFT